MSDLESMHDLVGAYALNAITNTERTAFEDHLDNCAQCREEFASFGGVLDALTDDAADQVQVPAGLAERIGASIALTPQVSTTAASPADRDGGSHDVGATFDGAPVSDGHTAELPPVDSELLTGESPTTQSSSEPSGGPQPGFQQPRNAVSFDRAVTADSPKTAGSRASTNPAGRRSRLTMLLATAAAAVAVAAVGIGFLVSTGSPDANLAAVESVLGASDARTLDLDVGDAQITVSASAGGFAATGSAPALATGEEYQLWLVNLDGTIDPGPTFESGDFQTAAIVDLSGVQAIAVSVEPNGGSEQPTTDPITAVEI